MNLASQSVEGGDSKYSIITHDKMPPGGDNGVTHSGPLNEMPPDGYLLAEEPGAGGVSGAPPDGAYLERLANKGQANTAEDGTTLEGGESKSSTTTHDNITNSPDGILLAAEPCAGGAPPDGAYQVNTTKYGDTLQKVAS